MTINGIEIPKEITVNAGGSLWYFYRSIKHAKPEMELDVKVMCRADPSAAMFSPLHLGQVIFPSGHLMPSMYSWQTFRSVKWRTASSKVFGSVFIVYSPSIDDKTTSLPSR